MKAARGKGLSGLLIFSYGFRPFFLAAGAWSALAMLLWIGLLSGWSLISPPIGFDPVAWHAHEFLFGYLGAVIAGFLLTAVPNWTGRAPVTGWPLIVLVALWIAGRLAMAMSGVLSPLAVAVLDLAFPMLLTAIIGFEIAAGSNWRNLKVVALLAVLSGANAAFHWAAGTAGITVDGAGFRTGVAAVILLIALIGGRIIPAFTRGWMKARGEARLPATPGQMFDQAALMGLLVALAFWVSAPASAITGACLAAAGVLHFGRLARWRGHRTLSEPLVWVLHAGYACLPLGAVLLGLSVLFPERIAHGSALHLWLAGAVGLMTLAVMTRATLGHTGRPLQAGRGTTAIYLAVILSALLRVFPVFVPDLAWLSYQAAALFWLGGFGAFVLIYGPMMLRPPVKN